MPELDVFLVFFPAEKNFPTADDRRKIHQSTINVLDHDFSRPEFCEQVLKVQQSSHPAIDRFSTRIRAFFHYGTDAFLILLQLLAKVLELLEPLPEQRQQRPRFV